MRQGADVGTRPDVLVVDGASLSVDRDADHNLVLTVYRGTDGDPVVRILMPPAAVIGLMRDVAHHGANVLTEVATEQMRGDCVTCSNRRLVPAPGPGGRTWNERCPDCAENPQPWRNYPRVGGGRTSGGPR